MAHNVSSSWFLPKLALSFILLAAAFSWAEQATVSADEIRITGDEFFGSMSSQTTFRGDVEFSSDKINLSADQITADWLEGRPVRIVAEGTQTSIEIIQNDASTMAAKADVIDYKLSDNEVELRGNVMVVDGDRQLQSELLRYNIEAEEFTAQSVEAGAQVEITWEAKKTDE